MQKTTTTTVSMTEEEYIQFELNADIRHEYVNGQLIDMPGESSLNNGIAMNLAFALKPQFKGTLLRPYAHDLKIKIPDVSNYFYPDLFVTDEQMSSTGFVVRRAFLVVEVLSKSTRSFDAYDKYIQYKKIPELCYYMLIEPEKKVITLFSKNDLNEWQSEIFIGPDERINLPAINASFTIAELYE